MYTDMYKYTNTNNTHQVGLTEEEYIEVPHTETRQIAMEEEEIYYERQMVPRVQQQTYSQQPMIQQQVCTYRCIYMYITAITSIGSSP
jgi:hypothetical protein